MIAIDYRGITYLRIRAIPLVRSVSVAGIGSIVCSCVIEDADIITSATSTNAVFAVVSVGLRETWC